MKVQFSLK